MKKPLLIAILLFACVNIGILLGFFFGEKPRRVTINAPPNRQALWAALFADGGESVRYSLR